ncbi:hypothetical protein GGI12_002559, partial [Dipsacomyces acuminosporus]
MELLAIIQGLYLSALYARQAAADCTGANGTIIAQCQRLYSVPEFKSIPMCIDADKLPITRCLQEADRDKIGIPECDEKKFGSAYPDAYL